MYKIIDREVIFDFLGDDPEMIPQMLEMILANQIPDLRGLEALYTQGKLEEVKSKCHRGKSAMGYLGALHVKEHLQEMESDVSDSFHEKNEKLQNYLTQIETEVNLFLEEL